FWWMAASVSENYDTTADEVSHLAAGHDYWANAAYNLQPENGNFPQRWAALPLAALTHNFPSPEDPAMKGGDVWRAGFDYFYRLGNAPDALLAAGRAMIALLGCAVAAAIFFWSRSLFGEAGGFVSLLLAVFCPVMLAHAGLATSDMAATLGFIVALLAWWRLLHCVSAGRVLAAGGALGLLAVAKFSCVLFAPMAALLLGARLLRRVPLPVAFGGWRVRLRGARQAAALAGGGLVAVALAVAVIWASYGFRYAALPPGMPGGFLQEWDRVLMTTPSALQVDMADRLPPQETVQMVPGAVQKFVAFARDHRLLPEAWLYGLAFVERSSRFRMAYFAGEYRLTGWWEFFPAAFLLKTTLPALGLLLLAAFVPLWGPHAPCGRLAWRLLPLLVLLGVYWTFALTSHLNIGHRHLLPTYPALYILLGITGWAAMRAPRGRRALGAAVALALGWHAGESLRARPGYLASFNELAGAPENTHRLFVDSTLDWGQDLPGLKAWLDIHARGEKVFISYFGSGDPEFEGIHATRVADNHFDLRPHPTVPLMTGGVWCLSATMLHRSYSNVRGPWSQAYENEYERLTGWLHHLVQQPKGEPPTATDGTPLTTKQISDNLFDLEQLRFARLCHFLQLRQPDADIGHTILIYRLSDAEVSLALFADLPLLNAAAAAQAAR
ncbi:MAG: hypothetical protein WCL04_09395, partial [Verrucomicrobiota bacterium]